MFGIQKRLGDLKEEFAKIWQQLDIDMRLFEMSTLEEEVAVPEIWNNPENACLKTTRLANLHDELDEWVPIRTSFAALVFQTTISPKCHYFRFLNKLMLK